MLDGESYAVMAGDKAIDIYSYKTGKKTSRLFDVAAIKGDLKIDSFKGYEISADGRKILLWNNTEQIYRHSFLADYYVYDIARSTLKKVSDGGKQRGAVISHDGRMVAFNRDGNIFISNLDYGTEIAITSDGKKNEVTNGTPDWGYEEEFGVLNTMHFSADDNTLVYLRFDESKVPVYNFDDYRSYCMSDPLADDYPVSYSYKYPLAGYPNSVVSVKAYEVNDRTTKTMDLPIGETGYVPDMQFAGDGKTLMVMVLNRDQNHLTLYSADTGSTVARPVYEDRSDAWLSPAAYQMVDYGDKTFIIGSERSGYRHLYEYDYSGNPVGQLTSGEFNVTDFYGRDAKTGECFVQTTSLGATERNIARVGKKGLSLFNDVKGFESASFSRNFQYYVRTWSDAVTPPQYAVYTVAGKKICDLQLNREYAARYERAPRKEFTQAPAADGQMMNAYIIKPFDFDPNKKYPLLMYQYNGPDSQEVLNRWKMEGIYYLASQGVIVACVDGRGTGNRSRKWANAVYKKLGQLETADQISGARHFASLPYVDAERVACFGWSYGGYMTLMEMTDQTSPFKCGVAMAPVTDWRFYDSIYTERYMLTPQQNESGYDAASALDRTDDLKGRLLIMSGTSDDNVHFYNTLKFTSKLNYEGKIFDMMALTGFEHSLRMCNARTMLFRKIDDFLKIHL